MTVTTQRHPCHRPTDPHATFVHPAILVHGVIPYCDCICANTHTFPSDWGFAYVPRCLASHNSYELTNQRLQGKFAAAAFRLWLEAGQDMDKCCHKIALSQLNKLAISFRDCAALTDETCRLLAANLPSTLEEVRSSTLYSSMQGASPFPVVPFRPLLPPCRLVV